MKARLLGIAATVAIVGATCFGLGWAAAAPGPAAEPGAYEHHEGHWVVTGPNCPTESDCRAYYQDGNWHIEEAPN
jgi:hypothetical protein